MRLVGRIWALAVYELMHARPTDEQLVELALKAFRNPPVSYYDWIDAVLAERGATRSADDDFAASKSLRLVDDHGG